MQSNLSETIPLIQPERPAGKIQLWLTAVRPFAYTASVSAVLLGASLSFYHGYDVLWIRLFLTLAGVVCFHTSANLLNDCFDHRMGVDNEVLPLSGAVVRGWLTEKQVFRAALLFLILGILSGILLWILAGSVVLYLGIIGTVIVLFYTKTGFSLKYVALGDAAIFITFGLLPVFGTYWVQTEHFHWLPLWWSVLLVSYIVGILHANNWRDIESDQESGCRTFASILGRNGSRIYYRILMLGPYFLAGTTLLIGQLYPHFKTGPLSVLLVFISLPRAVSLARIDPKKNPDLFKRLDGETAQLQLFFGVLMAFGFYIGHLIPPIH